MKFEFLSFGTKPAGELSTMNRRLEELYPGSQSAAVTKPVFNIRQYCRSLSVLPNGLSTPLAREVNAVEEIATIKYSHVNTVKSLQSDSDLLEFLTNHHITECSDYAPD